jgi:hypothetical protein
MAQLLLAVPLAFHLIAASGNGSGVPTFDVRPSAAQRPWRKSRSRKVCEAVWLTSKTLTINS